MQHITVESPVAEKLSQSAGQILVCDAEGRVIGFFSPLKDRPRLVDLNLEPPPIEQTPERAESNRTGKPLEEILGRLGF